MVPFQYTTWSDWIGVIFKDTTTAIATWMDYKGCGLSG